MTGNGSRFRAAGYERLKPFIEIQQKTMIEWVVSMFRSTNTRIVFICRQEHLENLPYVKQTLTIIAPEAEIVEVKDWQKLGPVADVLQCVDIIDPQLPILVSYCDYYMHWNFTEFIQQAKDLNCEGAIPCYTGFHPHLIPQKNLYASCKVDDNQFLLEIKEKFSWTEDKTRTLHSPGAYYFKNKEILRTYFTKSMQNKLEAINGEFYVSMVYNHMINDDLRVWCPANIEHFCQWGTPEDLKEYLFWTDNIKSWSV